jgi:hypothetical protein
MMGSQSQSSTGGLRTWDSFMQRNILTWKWQWDCMWGEFEQCLSVSCYSKAL